MSDTDSVHERFAASRAYADDASRLIPGAVNSNIRLAGFPFPLCFERGEGAYLHDLDGNRFIDYVLGMGPTVLGHAPPGVCDAVAQSLSRGQMLGGQHREELLLAERLEAAIPSAERVRIGMTGSEVVQAAIRVSRAFTGKRRVIKFEGQYHGWFDNVLLSYGPPVDTTPGAADPGSLPPHLETEGQSASVADDIIVLPWNDAHAVRSVLEERGNEIAAILTEPAMCNTGAIAPVDGYLEALRELATRHRVVLIFDEVITGFRLALGGGQERFGVTPDLSTFAKALGGGFPIAALVGRADIMDLFGAGRVNHSGTYNANVPSVAAAIASLDLLGAEGGKPLREMERRGERLMEGLRERAAGEGVDLRVQGFGSCFNTFFSDRAEISDYRSYRRTDLAKQARFLEQLVRGGIRPTSRGTWFVSAAHSDDDVAETLECVERALAALTAG